MKKLLFIPLFLLPVAVKSQSFYKGINVIDLRGELAAYKTESHDKVKNTSSSGGAASKLLNLTYERGLFTIMGVGLKMQYDSYFTDEDTILHTPPQANEIVQPSVRSFDIAPVVNVHLARGPHFDFDLGMTYGISFLGYRLNDATDARARGTGTWFDVHMSPRFYFGEHFGMHLNLSYARFNYPSVIAESSTTQAINAFSLRGGGMTFGIGFNYRFGKDS
jgi:hypothetical protein